MIEFSLPTNEVPLSTIFDQLQNAQETLHLQDFSVSQTTLDQVKTMRNDYNNLKSIFCSSQVFVSFANQQINDYQSPMVSRSKPTYSNPAFTKSSEELNEAKKRNCDNAIVKHRNGNGHNAHGNHSHSEQHHH